VNEDTGEWLTLSDMARRLNRPPSTIWNWRKTYRDLIPSRRSARGQVLYPVAVFERIRGMADQRLTPREIRADLSGEQPAAEPPGQPQPTIADLLAQMVEHNALLRDLNGLMAEMNGYLRELLARR
jgi:transposase-like protein